MQHRRNMEKEELLQKIEQQNFKRISDAIKVLWGHKECDDYLNKQIIDERGNRQGFPHEVLSALLKLHGIHSQEFKFNEPKDGFSINLGH